MFLRKFCDDLDELLIFFLINLSKYTQKTKTECTQHDTQQLLTIYFLPF